MNRRMISSNLLWFAISVLLAFFVWLIASLQTDPVRVTVFNSVPIQMVENDAMIVLNRTQIRRTVSVNVRARQSVLQLMSAEDVTVRADLSNLPPGTHAVPLEVSTVRRATLDTRPAQITVTLEQRQARQKPVEVRILSEPPAGYERGDIVLGDTQVLVSGTLAAVDQIERLLVSVDLSQQRTNYEAELPLTAVDSDNVGQSDVTLGQSTVSVRVTIRQREDVLSVPVRPLIDFDSVPSGYAPRLDSWTPEMLTLRGSPAVLAALPEVLDTQTIDLTNRTDDFTVTVPVMIPDSLPGTVTVLEGQTIQVSVAIQARISQSQFDDVPVSAIGSSVPVRVIPSRVTVLLTGAQPDLAQLTVSDISVTVDVTDLASGTYDLAPVARVASGEFATADIRVIPATIGVIVSPRP